ncbi:MAG: sn-glycerol-3-phosphate ABC transporter ATP-binding protein UgpC [Mesorhizobium sp.]|nr:MAG: sn-glycerol-3-phosphate ABC transporter ATP-binding protein UgpC [Mesorhizobium sp.]
MATVSLKKLTKRYGNMEIVHGIDLDIADREFIALVGPSGCGKSTTLRMIAGLEDISGGNIDIGGRVVNDLPPRSRNISMVFQSYALYPHMTVRENLGFSLKIAGAAKDDMDRRVAEASAILGLDELLERRPSQLSGGQRQRVAMGRAIVRDPDVFLFDEPLSNLDAKLRTQMRTEIKKLHAKVKSTVIYVTHDQVEAMTLADRIVIMRSGQIEQVGTPDEVFSRPATRFVAGFIGSPPMNFLKFGGGLAKGAKEIVVQGSKVAVPEVREDIAPADMALGIRPEHIRFDDGSKLRGAIYGTEYLGTTQIVAVETADGIIKARVPAGIHLSPGEQVGLTLSSARLSLFEKGSGRAVRTAMHDQAAEARHG